MPYKISAEIARRSIINYGASEGTARNNPVWYIGKKNAICDLLLWHKCGSCTTFLRLDHVRVEDFTHTANWNVSIKSTFILPPLKLTKGLLKCFRSSHILPQQGYAEKSSRHKKSFKNEANKTKTKWFKRCKLQNTTYFDGWRYCKRRRA